MPSVPLPGAGPSFICERGLVSVLRQTVDVPIHEVTINPVDDFEGEIGRSFELIRRTAKAVAKERNSGSFPIVLSGNCSAAVGVAAGLHATNSWPMEELGCVWFDAHDDFNTPDTVLSGYFDSMPKGLLKTVPGHKPLKLERLVNVGMRDVTDTERARVIDAGFDVVWGNVDKKVDFSKKLHSILASKERSPTMVHLDLDCLDSSLSKVNQFSAPRGLFEEDLAKCLAEVSELTEPASLTVASFDPSCKGAESIANIAIRTIKLFIESLMSTGILDTGR
ncbi:putative arginase [Xylogone sp. PMI_703]|nr:putative arginase [Xylogone sp. PMI_703]